MPYYASENTPTTTTLRPREKKADADSNRIATFCRRGVPTECNRLRTTTTVSLTIASRLCKDNETFRNFTDKGKRTVKYVKMSLICVMCCVCL